MAEAAKTDVVVIGGAVMGASVAYWLTRMQPGLDVLVVERDPSFAHASTALSVASIRQQFTTAVNVQISRFGVDFIRNFQGTTWGGRRYRIAWVQGKRLSVSVGKCRFRSRAADVAAMQRSLGAATEVLEPEALKARFPWLEVGDLMAGSFGARDEGWFDNMGLLAGFRAAARAQGARFVPG